MAGILANSVSQTMGSGDTAVDQAVSGYLSGETITLTTSPTGSAYTWALAIPTGSAVTRSALSSTSIAGPTFRPDVAGDYLVTADVDGTTYVIRINVVQAAVTTSLEAIRYAPQSAASVVAPAQGQATFYDDTLLRLRAKNSDATYVELGPRVGSVSLTGGSGTITDATITSSTHVSLTLTTASNLGTISVAAGSGSATITSTDGSDASTFSYALIG